MSLTAHKIARMMAIENLLLSHPEGLTQAEIARRLGVNRSTINRYFPNLPAHIYIDDLDHNKWKIDRQAYLVNVKFDLNEALAIHLATRLLATRMDRQNPFAASAMRKLGIALEHLAPQICRHMQQSAESMDEPERRQDPIFLEVMRGLTISWAEQRKVNIWHRSERTGLVSQYLFSPYFIEPYAIGQTTMLIGYSAPPGKLRTLKIERIERIELTRENYTIPATFDPRELLADAWGIWYTEVEPIQVVLKFHPRVAMRVKETSWHRSQQIEELDGGFLLWRARIAEPQEMLPWVRGWGADVEVLQPEGMRKMIANEAGRLSEMYRRTSKEAEQ